MSVITYQQFSNQMTGVTHTPLYVASLLSVFGALPLKHIVVITSIADAAFHYWAKSNMKTFQASWKMEGAAALIRSIGLIWSSGHLIRTLGYWTKALSLSSQQIEKMPFRYGFYSWAAVAGGFWVVGKVIDKLNQWHLSHQKLEKLDELAKKNRELLDTLVKVTLAWDKPAPQTFGQGFYVLQTTVNIALAILSNHPLPFAIAAISNLYTLYQMTQRDWLSITKENSQYNLKLRFTYRPIFLPDVKSSEENSCAICLDNKGKSFYFCENHSFHQMCLTSLFVTATEQFAIIKPPIRVSKKTNNTAPPIVTYNVVANNDIKPRCPQCRKTPLQNELTIHVWDPQTLQWCWGNVSWEKS